MTLVDGAPVERIQAVPVRPLVGVFLPERLELVKGAPANRRAHLDPEWAREHLPWHYDHHMGRDQNANWCVTYPLFDYVMGTRRKYLGQSELAEARVPAA